MTTYAFLVIRGCIHPKDTIPVTPIIPVVFKFLSVILIYPQDIPYNPYITPVTRMMRPT